MAINEMAARVRCTAIPRRSASPAGCASKNVATRPKCSTENPTSACTCWLALWWWPHAAVALIARMEEAYMRRDVKAASDVGGAPGNSGRVAGLMKSHKPKKV